MSKSEKKKKEAEQVAQYMEVEEVQWPESAAGIREGKNQSSTNGGALNYSSLELRELLKYIDSNKSVSIESFAKIVPEYDGISIPIRNWLRNFNENADAYELTDKQKYVNARNKMTGTAKLFLETISVANYENLCKALVEEFDEKLRSIDIHQKLTKRRKRDEENFHQYVLEMRKLAALRSIEEQAVIRYIVNGLRMCDDLKYPLYSATTYKELRERYDLIQQMSTKQSSTTQMKTQNERNTQKHNDINYDTRRQHCFNCGSTAHARAECKAETKCFKCNGSGHIAKNCAKQNQVMSIVGDNKRSKQMLIGNKAATCLIDTGADVSLMRECFYKNYFSNIAFQKSAAK